MTATSRWGALMGVDDAGAIDVAARWNALTDDRDPRRLQIPIGFLPDGQTLELDLKSPAEGGAGPHGIHIGHCGSGKSEFLRNLVLNGCLGHSPALLNWLLIDGDGNHTFAGMADLPHVADVITGRDGDEVDLAQRVAHILDAQISRRAAIQLAAGQSAPRDDIAGGGADPAPLPHLVVVVTEFSALLQAHPDLLDVLLRVLHCGRSLRICLLLSARDYDLSGRLAHLEACLGYRIALHTATAQQSRALLAGSDAAYQMACEPGRGLLLATSCTGAAGDPIEFQCGYTGAPYTAAGGAEPDAAAWPPPDTVFTTVARQLAAAEPPPPGRRTGR